MVLKDYQSGLLDAFEAFLARARELKSPQAAFAESTLAAFGHALQYVPLPNATDVPSVCVCRRAAVRRVWRGSRLRG